MKFTITGELPDSDEARTLVYDNGNITADPVLLIRLQTKAEWLRKNGVRLGTVAFDDVPGGVLDNPLSLYLTLVEHVYDHGTATLLSGTFELPEDEPEGTVA